MAKQKSNDFTIVIAGQAGQGIESIASVLTHVFKKQDFNIYVAKDVMSRVRGGMNSITVRVSGERSDAFRSHIDYFVPLDPRAHSHYKNRLNEKTLIIGVAAGDDFKAENMSTVNFVQLAHEIGNRIYANTVAAGTILGLFDLDADIARRYMQTFFRRKGEQVVSENIAAIEKGLKIGKHIAFEKDVHLALETKEDVSEYVFLSGAEAVAFGALAGGVNFSSSYPMSPSTGVFTFLAAHGKECDVLAEQATDEIGAINMSLGASFAGARALVSTSGGGFALMTESVSLSAMTETPITVHIAQRPGPATGLPTRTGQEDLNLALYAGHGEFARAIFTPGTPEEMYDITAHAVELADKYQIPTFVLSDQLMMDSFYCVPREAFTRKEHHTYIEKTTKGYQRYEITDTGLSPRGVPGYGEGLVHADSDEHDEDGRITEDMTVMRPAMMEKRFFKRRDLLTEESLPPTRSGPQSAKTLIVSWGSNKNVVEEAVRRSGKKSIAALHFSQIFPLHPDTAQILLRAEKVIIVENNATGQFAELIARETEIVCQSRILKWNGEPFSVEELITKIKSLA